ncbi:MAG: fatty acid desaturase family protein [Deltaproteobacteria bacterium]|nr:fatty acid desaturase family protein [Deltaproteobacteria bacterium]
MDATNAVEDPSERLARASEAHWKSQLTKPELRAVLALDDRRSAWTLAVNWGLVFASIALVGLFPNPLTIVVALFVIGGRQLGCAIVMHEAAHRSLFSNRVWNDRLGNWLGAYPVLAAVEPYRRVHLLHHAHTGTAADPDLALTAPFPITRQSLARKVFRDLTGQTGYQQIAPVIAGNLQREGGWRRLVPFVVTNLAIAAVPIAFGRPALALLWPIALLTTHRLALRIRSIAEHAMAGPAEDPLRNTRTTLVRWWERLLFAPDFVNYHLEHHLLMTVPHYRLPRLHALLRDKGLLAGALVTEGGYREVLRRATSTGTSAGTSAVPAA